MIAGDGPGAVTASWDWFGDEPFASESPTFGSYHASAGEDYATGLAFATEGLKPNPDDSILLNNAAFCLGCSGRVDEGRRMLERIKNANVGSVETKAAVFATRGLLDYRSGFFEEGRKNYSTALTTTKDATVRALAAIMFAKEEIRAATPFGLEAARRAFELEEEAQRSGGAADTELRSWLRQLRAAMADHAVK